MRTQTNGAGKKGLGDMAAMMADVTRTATGLRSSNQSLDEAFPPVDPGAIPVGSGVLVQLRTAMTKSAGGVILPDETQETEKWNAQTAKVIALGPLAFHNRNTGEPWPEGAWCKPGEFVRVPKYGGDRWAVPIGPGKGDALFVIYNDLSVLAKVTADPRSIKAFI